MTTTYKQNEWLSAADKEKFADMKKNNYQRYLVAGEANWGVATGQFFTEWNERRHVVKPFEIPQGWNKFRAMDWGLAKPYAVLWFAVDYDGNLYCYRELYGWGGKPNVGTGETAAAVGKRIAALEKPAENVRSGVLDSACFARTGVTGETIAEAINKELYKANLTTFGKSSKGRVEGANALKQRLIGNKNSDGEFVPAIYFFSTCLHTIRTLPMLGHDKHNAETYDTDGEDHCLIAGTLIKTTRGDIPIENVTAEDYVLTRKGFKKVLASAMTKRNAKVLTVKFSDGKSLTGTGNHPVYVEGKGFIRLDAISYGDIICVESEVLQKCQENNQIQQIVSYSTELNSDVTQIQNDKPTAAITAPVPVIVNRELLLCTEKFGNSIMVQFLKVSTFTTKTKIFLIMIFLILNCAPALNIFQNICLKNFKTTNLKKLMQNIWILLEKKPPNGTAPKKAESGTENTELKLQSQKLKSQKLNVRASSAAKSFLLSTIKRQSVNFVQELVAPNIAVTKKLTMKQESAQFAAKNLASIDSVKLKPVAKNVVYAVCYQTEKRNADVYNLTIEDEHEYFANGVLVHNCMDAICYACLSRPYAPEKVKPARKIDRYNKPEKPSVWTI